MPVLYCPCNHGHQYRASTGAFMSLAPHKGYVRDCDRCGRTLKPGDMTTDPVDRDAKDAVQIAHELTYRGGIDYEVGWTRER